MTAAERPGYDPAAIERMPLVRWVIDGAKARRPLAGRQVLLIQHQLENHLAQAKGLLELGVEPGDLHWIDIPYTASDEIRAEVVALGVPEENFVVHDYNLTQRYTPYQRTRVTEWIKWFLNEHGKDAPLLVMDDGGYFLEAMVCFRDHIDALAVVEQTARGLRKYRENDAIRHYCADVPLINVAESAPKKDVESPIIAAAVCDSIRERLNALLEEAGVALSDGEILVLGYGAIGEAVCQELVEDHAVPPNRLHVYDLDPAKRALAEAAGHRIWVRDAVTAEFALVVGCTGKQSFDVWNYVHLARRSVLISASSGSSEVAREDFVEIAAASPADDIYIEDPSALTSDRIHSDIVVEVVHHTVTIANGGFPINFDGILDRIPPEEIQITVAMMLFGAIQAVETPERGLIDLDEEFCDELRRRFEHQQELR